MNAIRLACTFVGTPADLARVLGIKSPTIHQWISGRRPIPIEKCVDVERATGLRVRRWDLRPADWHRIWPELIGIEGAPVVPAADVAPAEAH